MESEQFILGDWGTSTLKLSLCSGSSDNLEVIGSVTGAGVKHTTDFEAALLRCAADLPPHRQDLPIYLSGMVGSSIGWKEARYAQCPAPLIAITDGVATVKALDHQVLIAPGLSCRNRYGLLDFMRGEEIQIYGWMASNYTAKESDDSRRLLCLPGTHTKWVIVRTSQIEQFVTTLQGELYDVLDRYSILTDRRRDERREAPLLIDDSFHLGVSWSQDHGSIPLLVSLFSVRAAQLSGRLDVANAHSLLSGVLVSADVRGVALQILAEEGIAAPVIVIGEPGLCDLYTTVFSAFEISSKQFDGRKAALLGLDQFRRALLINQEVSDV